MELELLYSVKVAVLVTILVLVIAAVLALSSLALAQGGGEGTQSGVEGNQAEPPSALAVVSGGPGFYSQGAIGCRPWQDGDGYAFSGQTLYHSGTGSGYFECPLSLPNGATVTKFVVYYYDNSSNDLTAYLLYGPLDNNYGYQMAAASSSGAQSTFRYSQDITISNATVNQRPR